MKERIDDLQINGFKIIQNTDLFCYGMDAVLLSDFAKAGRRSSCLDLCAGNGIITLLMAAKGKGNSYCAIEIQEESARLVQRNIDLNKLDNATIINDDIKQINNIIKRQSVDVVTCNPPYMQEGDGLVNPKESVAVARHEIMCNINDVAKAASYALKANGHFFLVHRPRRIVSVLCALRSNNLEPKRIRYVHSYNNKEAFLVLIEAVKDGREQMIIEPPLIVYNKDGKYTDEVKEIYGINN